LDHDQTLKNINHVLYSKLAWVYDSVYDDTASYAATARFATKLIGKRKMNILEPGCGTGRLTKALLNLGHMVTGVDMHETMLDFARKRAKAQFFKEDFRNLDFDSKFDSVILNTPTFTYMMTNKDAMNALRSFNRALKRDGRLFLENFSAHYVLEHLPSNRGKQVYKRIQTKITRVNWTSPRFLENISYEWEPVYIIEKDRQPPEVYFDHVVLRAFFADELFILLKSSGFEVEGFYGKTEDWRYASWDNNSPEVVVLARKL
jgi:ubiquinone/menaquinone biosynthesis C-methylase UbiE